MERLKPYLGTYRINSAASTVPCCNFLQERNLNIKKIGRNRTMIDSQANDDHSSFQTPTPCGPYPGILSTPYVYCGSTTNDLDSILLHGLRPLEEDEEGKSEYPPPHGFLGLTRANGLYFAADQSFFCAEDGAQPDPVILEIDTTFLDLAKLYPGEIYLGWANDEVNEKGHEAPVPPPISMSLPLARREWVRSFEKVGLVTYKGHIPLEAIVRYAVVNQSLCPNLMELAGCLFWDYEVWPARLEMAKSITNCIFNGTRIFDHSWRYESCDSLLAERLELMKEAAAGDPHAPGKLVLVDKHVQTVARIRAMSEVCLEEQRAFVRVVNLRQ